MRRTLLILLPMAALGCAGLLRAQTFTDPAAAGVEFQIQGEYVGAAGGEKLGAQVIALGNGAFQAVFLPGGLPGAGWDATKKIRIRVPGQLEGNRAAFNAAGWSGILAGEQFTGKTPEGTEFALQKVRRQSPTLGKKPPASALVLFDGTNVDAWQNGRKTEDGLLMVGTGTKRHFGAATIHLEFRTPFQPLARGQGRGNSGVYVAGRHEVQVLDSFGLDGRNNECGGLYGKKAPDVNMCFPPLSWQTYDIDFTPAQIENGQVVREAAITVRHNGVVIHDQVVLPGDSGQPGPLNLQNHGNPVHYRNIWLIER